MLESLTNIELILAVVILVGAYLIRGITGFGSGLIAIPLLALMLPITIVVPMIGLLDYSASLSHGINHRKSIQWREIVPLLPFSLVGVLSALYIFKTVDGELLKQILGGFILLYAFYSIFGHNPRGQISRKWSFIGGGFGGLIGTLFGTGGPFYVIYLQLRGLGKTEFRATIAIIFMLDGAARIVGYFLSGFYSVDTITLVVVSIPVMAGAMYIGGHIHTNISPDSFKRAIGFVLLGSGAALLFY